MVKAILTYEDEYGNTSRGFAIVSGTLDPSKLDLFTGKPILRLTGPQAYIDMWGIELYRNFAILPEDAPELVGFYTCHSHFQVMEKYGLTGRLMQRVLDAHREFGSYESEARGWRWYADGLTLKPKYASEQQTLY